MKIYCTVFLLGIIFFCNCTVTKKYGNTLKNSKVVKINPGLFKTDLDNTSAFFSEIQVHDNAINLVYFNSDKEFCIANIFTNDTVKKISLAKEVKNLEWFQAAIQDSTIYLLDVDHSKFIIYKLTGNSLLVKESYNLQQSITGNGHLIFQIPKAFAYYRPHLFIRYGPLDNSNFGQDQFAYLYFKLSGDSQLTAPVKKVLPNLQTFQNGTQQIVDTYIKPVAGTDNFIFASKASDSVFLFSGDDCSIKTAVLSNPFSNFQKYDPDKCRDLSYHNHYAKTNEFNNNFFTDTKGNSVFIKRIRKKELYDKEMYEYIVLDKNLHQKYYNVFENEIDPRYCAAYLNGFVIASKDLTKLYYYEME